MHVVKLMVYRQTSILSFNAIDTGLIIGPVMILGSWIGKRVVQRLPERWFVVLVELTLLFAGLNFLLRAA
jgi:uncharacterized membrane protein YfcA